jgi:hypothetical protein
MAETVAQHQQSTFTDPQNGQALDASVVLTNLNALKTTLNAHDADSGIHLQSGLHASRPAAGTTGRKWYSTDTKRLYYDNGTTWAEIGYLAIVTAGEVAGPLLISGDVLTVAEGIAITDGGLAVTAGGIDVAAGGLTVTGETVFTGPVTLTRVDAGDTSTAKTLDFSTGNIQKVRLTGNCTFTFSNPVVGTTYIVELLQDGTGSRTATWPATVKWEGGTAPTLTTTASRKDVLVFVFNGTNYFGGIFGLNYTDTV